MLLRHCLWIPGNGDTLIHSSPIWRLLAADAKAQHCNHVTNEDKTLGGAITNALFEHSQFDDLLDKNSVLFKKVIFHDDFLKSVGHIENLENNKEVHSLLMRLSGG